jgi:hypothetical protein
MFGFFKRRVEVLDHWIAFADGFHVPVREVYDALEAELKARQVPGLEAARIEFAEGGLLSEKRIYLRLLRERLVFDVCAAPFGTGFFFSCRAAEIPLRLQWWHLLVLLFGGGFATFGLFTVYFQLLGTFAYAAVSLVVTYGFIIYGLRNLIAFGLEDLDRTLIRLPVVGPLYEVLFRQETYYRLDTRMCYVSVVKEVVRRHAEEVTAAKGVQLVRQFERAPLFSELYQPARPLTGAVPAEPPMP